MNKLSLLIKVSRPIAWIIAPIVFLASMYIASASFSWQSIVQIVLLSFPFCILLYGINDVYDYKSDKINFRKGYLEGLKLGKFERNYIAKWSYVIIIVLLLSSILTLNLTNIFGMILLLFASYFYSAPPIRFKTIPIVDSLSNGVIFIAVAILGFSFGGSIIDFPVGAYFVALCVSAMHSIAAVCDYLPDKKANHRTIAVFLGKRFAIAFSIFLFIVVYFFSHFQSIIIKYYLLYCIALCTILFFKPERRLARLVFYLLYAGFIFYVFLFILFKFFV